MMRCEECGGLMHLEWVCGLWFKGCRCNNSFSANRYQIAKEVLNEFCCGHAKSVYPLLADFEDWLTQQEEGE